MSDEDQPEEQIEVRMTGALPGDVLGYMDWDDPSHHYWTEPEGSVENKSRHLYGQKYASFYQRARFGAADIPALFDAFAEEQDEAFRSYVVICVSRLDRTQEVLVDLLSRAMHGNESCRALAVRALGLFSTAAAKRELLKALQSQEVTIARAAAGALAHHGGTEVEEALLETLRSDDENTVNAVLAALQRIGGQTSERELLRLANNRVFFERHQYNLLAALSSIAGDSTRERLPDLLRAGVLDDWTLRMYFGRFLNETERATQQKKKQGFAVLFGALLLIGLIWWLGTAIARGWLE